MAAQGGVSQFGFELTQPVKAASAGNWNGCAINAGGTLPLSGGLDAIGIVQSPDGHAIGDMLTVTYFGIARYRNAHTAVMSARALMTINASGRAVVAAAGQYVIGRNWMKTGDPDGQNKNVGSSFYGVGMFNFMSPWFAPNSALAVSFYG